MRAESRIALQNFEAETEHLYPRKGGRVKQRTLFSELKASEGGHGLKGARELLRVNGIETTPAPEGSIYVGHIAFYVLGDAKTVERAERLLWG